MAAWASLCGCLLAAVASAAPLAAQGDPTAGRVAGTLRLADWRGSVLGRGTGGTLALLAGDDGSYRAELAEGAAPPAALLERRGRGWTLVLPPAGNAIAQPWDREWRRLDADATAGLRAVAAALVASDPARSGARRLVLAPAGPPAGFRATHAARGRGRGGPGETLVFVRAGDPAAGGSLALRSSRRPGTLRFAAVRCLPVSYLPDEAFVPLWPLRELLDTGGEIPGTCPPAGG